MANSFGGAAGAIFPVVPGLLDFQADFPIGDGIGRYGATGLPDVTNEGIFMALLRYYPFAP
jgi:hypothetical protein